jgi:hypothetical protein
MLVDLSELFIRREEGSLYASFLVGSLPSDRHDGFLDVPQCGEVLLHRDPGLRSSPSANTNLLLSVMGAFAEFERALVRERQRQGIALAKQRRLPRPQKVPGRRPGRPVPPHSS